MPKIHYILEVLPGQFANQVYIMSANTLPRGAPLNNVNDVSSFRQGQI